MGQLIVKLPARAPENIETRVQYALATDATSEPKTFESSISELPKGHDLVLVAPGAKCSWFNIELPSGLSGERQIKSALMGVVEEFSLDEPEDLHLSLMGKTSDGKTQVVACDKAWLQSCVDILKLAGRVPRRIVPEWSPSENTVALAFHDDARGSCLAVSDPQGAAIFPLCRGAIPDHADLYAEPSLARALEQIAGGTFAMQSFGARMAKASAHSHGMDQFDFSSAQSMRWKMALKAAALAMWSGAEWRIARWALVLFFALNGGALIGKAWQLQARLSSTEKAMRAEVTKTFPKIGIPIEPELMMAREVANLRTASGEPTPSDFESMLAAIGSNIPQGSLASVKYSAGSLRFKAPGLGASVVEGLARSGYDASLDKDEYAMKPSQGASK